MQRDVLVEVVPFFFGSDVHVLLPRGLVAELVAADLDEVREAWSPRATVLPAQHSS